MPGPQVAYRMTATHEQNGTRVGLVKRSGNHPAPGLIEVAVRADPEGVAPMWLFQLALLLFTPTTVLVYSFVEPLEDRGTAARGQRD